MADTPTPWASLSADEHEFQYNPQAAFPDFKDAQAARAAVNADATARLARRPDVPYGTHPLHRVDIYPAEARDAPVHVFLHGGYWRAQDKANFAFVARPLVAAGITAAIANYELCPESTLDGVALSAVAAVRWVHRNAASFGGDPRRVSLSGHSAGAHLVAECLAHDWPAEGIDPAFIVGAVLISGIYDPRPVMRTRVNADVRLTEPMAARRDVEHRPILARPSVALFAGGREPWHWIDQTYRYAHHAHRAGLNPEVHVLPAWGHFDILNEFGAGAGPIVSATIQRARS